MPTAFAAVDGTSSSGRAIAETRPKSPMQMLTLNGRVLSVAWQDVQVDNERAPGGGFEPSRTARKMFPGFRSRWTIPSEWRYSTPSIIEERISREEWAWKQWRRDAMSLLAMG